MIKTNKENLSAKYSEYSLPIILGIISVNISIISVRTTATNPTYLSPIKLEK